MRKVLMVFAVMFIIGTLIAVSTPAYAAVEIGDYAYNYRINYSVEWDAAKSGMPSVTDHAVWINVTYNTSMNTSFLDVVFTNNTNSILDFWIQDYTASSWAGYWVEADELADGSNNIMMYFGNSSQTNSLSNINATFPIGTNMTVWDNSIWDDSSGATISAGWAKLYGADYQPFGNVRGTSWTENYTMVYRANKTHGSESDGGMMDTFLQDSMRLYETVSDNFKWEIRDNNAERVAATETDELSNTNIHIFEMGQNNTHMWVKFNMDDALDEVYTTSGNFPMAAKFPMFRAYGSKGMWVDWVYIRDYYGSLESYNSAGTPEDLAEDPPPADNPLNYNLVSQNDSTPANGEPVLLYGKWDDTDKIWGAWLSTNETGAWVNYTSGHTSSALTPLSDTYEDRVMGLCDQYGRKAYLLSGHQTNDADVKTSAIVYNFTDETEYKYTDVFPYGFNYGQGIYDPTNSRSIFMLGYNGTTDDASVWTYTEADGYADTGVNIYPSVRGACAVYVESTGEMLIYGGYHTATPNVSTRIMAYDLSEDTYRNLTENMDLARGDLACWYDPNRNTTFLIAGANPPASKQDDIQYHNYTSGDTGTWTGLYPMSIDSVQCIYNDYDECGYCFGGYTGSYQDDIVRICPNDESIVHIADLSETGDDFVVCYDYPKDTVFSMGIGAGGTTSDGVDKTVLKTFYQSFRYLQNYTEAWSNFTWQNSSVYGTVGWYIYANDSAGVENVTTIGSFVTGKQTPTIDITFNNTSPITEGTVILINCTAESLITPNLTLYNDTSIMSIPTTFTFDNAGTFNFTCNVTETAEYIAGSVEESMTVIEAGTLTITEVVNENNVSQSLTFDVSVYNSTYEVSSSGITTYSNNEVAGELTIIISADGYGTRTYYVDVPIDGYTMTGYLLNSSDGHNVLIYTKDALELLISGTAINVSRLSGSSWLLVEQGLTDDTGGYSLFLDGDVNYRITAEATGYDTKTVQITPTLSTYTIYLSGDESDPPSFWLYWKQIDADCTYTNATRLLNCTWDDSSGHLDRVWLKVTSRNSSYTGLLCNSTTTNSSGWLSCSFPFSATQNVSFLWDFSGDFSSESTSMTFDTGTWTDFFKLSLGITGVMISLLVLLVSGFMGIQMESPVMTVLLSTVGVGLVYFMGILDFGGGVITVFMGLAIAAGVLIFKMR